MDIQPQALPQAVAALVLGWVAGRWSTGGERAGGGSGDCALADRVLERLDTELGSRRPVSVAVGLSTGAFCVLLLAAALLLARFRRPAALGATYIGQAALPAPSPPRASVAAAALSDQRITSLDELDLSSYRPPQRKK